MDTIKKIFNNAGKELNDKFGGGAAEVARLKKIGLFSGATMPTMAPIQPTQNNTTTSPGNIGGAPLNLNPIGPKAPPVGENRVNIPENMGNTAVSNISVPMPPKAGGTTSASTTGGTTPSPTMSAYDKALGDYQKSTEMSPDQVQAQQQYNEAETGFNQRAGAVEGQGRGIWTGAVSGQQGQINRMKALSMMPLTQRLALLQQQQNAKQEASKIGLESEQYKQERSDKNSQFDQKMDFDYANAGITKNGTSGGVLKSPKLTEIQGKNADFASRMDLSLANLDRVEGEGYNRADISSGINALLPNLAQSSQTQQWEQAMKEFIAAVLRKDTGAAVTPEEFTYYSKIYGASTGDGAEVINQKKAARRNILNNFIAGSGGGYDYIKQTSGGGSAPSGQSSTGGFNF